MDALLFEKTEELAKTIAGEAKTIEDLNGVLKTLMKSALERMLGSELSVHLQDEQAEAAASSVAFEPAAPRGGRNRRNGTSPKSVQGDLGPIAVERPRPH